MITDRQQQAVDAYAEHGNMREAAASMGVAYSTFNELYHKGKAKLDLDPAIQDSMTAVGTGLIPALCMAWLKIARLANGPHADSYIDGAGYLAIASELSE